MVSCPCGSKMGACCVKGGAGPCFQIEVPAGPLHIPAASQARLLDTRSVRAKHPASPQPIDLQPYSATMPKSKAYANPLPSVADEQRYATKCHELRAKIREIERVCGLCCLLTTTTQA